MKFKWLILFFSIPVLSQSQIHRIDSLAKLLPSLKDSSRIDCLNKLSVEYYINALSETFINVNTDTAIYFASRAYDEGIKINYTKGVAEALQNLGEIARDRGNFSMAENYFRKSVPLFQQIHALEKYGWANLTLGYSLFKQCKYAEAEGAYERAMLYYTGSDNKEKMSMLFRLISLTYSARGYSEKAFDNTLKAISITDKISDARGVISSPENMANLYKYAGDLETALTYFRIAA
jgi:tetratricopeptide (TPR) repeat protein